jgi:hypothetical protein
MSHLARPVCGRRERSGALGAIARDVATETPGSAAEDALVRAAPDPRHVRPFSAAKTRSTSTSARCGSRTSATSRSHGQHDHKSHDARVDPQRRMASFVRGLLAGLTRVSCWPIAGHAGEDGPRGMQRLLSAAVWDEAGIRDDLRGYGLEHFAGTAAVLVVDEIGT